MQAGHGERGGRERERSGGGGVRGKILQDKKESEGSERYREISQKVK